MTEELKQKIDKIIRDYYTSPKALALYRNLKGLAYDVAEETTQELEKENAELKATIRNTKAVDESFALQTIQLTKAKELLRMVIDSYNHKERFSFEKDLMKAEQFLNSEEEKGMTENSNVPECPSIKIGCDKMYYVGEVEK